MSSNRLFLPDEYTLFKKLDHAILLKYVVTDNTRPPSYHIIRTILYGDGTVKEENPNLPYSWEGKWTIVERLDLPWLKVITGDYMNVMCIFPPNTTFKFIEYHKNYPTGLEYDVVVEEYVLKE